MIFLNLLLFNVTAGGVTAQRPNPMVRVPNGVLQGTWQVSTKGRLYASFQGVPYAGPPIEEYRFRLPPTAHLCHNSWRRTDRATSDSNEQKSISEPQPLKSWSGVWDATKPSSACLQYNSIAGLIIGSEDCLFLNVHTPQLQSNASLPVLVFLHGGAFMFGDGATYKATNIIDWDMVVVTMNYRLGPLGFLSTGDEVVPGNNGLKDQSFALHWIKNNIMMFGGNPDSITLTGNSAGGASVHYHYLSPLSRGTFTRGICFSGSALNPQHLSTKPVEKARTLAHIVGCPINSSEEMVDCLKKQPGEVIINAQIKMFAWKVNLFTPFTPCVEAPGVLNAFLQRDPYYATKNGFMMNLTLIATDTAEEGLYPAAAYQSNPFLLPDLEAHWDELADKIFVYSDTLPVSRRHEVAKAIKQHYLGGKPVSQETFPQLVQALGDRLFLDGVGKMVQFHAARSGQPTYVYRYAYRASRSLSNLLAHNNVNYGVSHADDVVYIFHQFKPDTKGDFAIIDVLMNMIYSFSTHGTPTPKNGPAWLPVTPSAKELNYLDILAPNKLVMNSTTDYGQKHFWDKLGFNEGENGRG